MLHSSAEGDYHSRFAISILRRRTKNVLASSMFGALQSDVLRNGYGTQENNIPHDFEPTPVEINLLFFVRYVPPSTEPLKNRKGKKPVKENNVAKRPLLLDNYADCDDEFWKLWGKKMRAVFVEHRLLRGIDMNWEFWSSLLGIGSLWLLSESSLLKEISPSNGRWTVINPEGTTLEDRKQHYLRCIVVGMVNGPQWKDIDRVLIPINIPQLHWCLADLDLLTWKLNIYDSTEWCGFFKKYAGDGSFKSLGDTILCELDHISYCAHFPNR
ncbi:unnamed protein product [Lactuca saligna]|uniref:Ubiquitin-like protease family profile domain-containing protein n=1 Tax=Lactuca saligna TaxID=75948 RepID=A0AA35ZS96_LACSI|nr:unnamed protein product [Lactuca saligna]